MHEIQNNWQRIESIVKWANMSTNYFARYIGLSRGENLYQIKRGHNGISRKLAERIVQHFPQIDMLWLLTGRGQMFVEENDDRGIQIPFYMLLMFLFWTSWGLFAGMLSAISQDFLNLVKSITQALFWMSGIMYDVNSININIIKDALVVKKTPFWAFFCPFLVSHPLYDTEKES